MVKVWTETGDSIDGADIYVGAPDTHIRGIDWDDVKEGEVGYLKIAQMVRSHGQIMPIRSLEILMDELIAGIEGGTIHG